MSESQPAGGNPIGSTIRVLEIAAPAASKPACCDDANVEVRRRAPDSSAALFDILRSYRPDVVVSYSGGGSEEGRQKAENLLNSLPFQVRRRWLSLGTPADLTSAAVETCFASAALGHPRDADIPLVSVVTTSFKSGHKICRPFASLLRQTYTNWEWLIFDDSPTDPQRGEEGSDNWALLQHLKSLDFRIRIFRSDGNGGVIGAIKYNASMLAQGSFIVELDHDDMLSEGLLETLVAAGKHFPKAGFFYSDFSEIHEAERLPEPGKLLEGTEKNFCYSDNWGHGFGAYAAELYDGRWRYVAQSPPLTSRTLRHIIAMPNHVRAWRTSLYRRLGGHCSSLPVADDYELMLRSFLQTLCVRLPILGYFQFRNQGGNNFTFLRNSLIQRMVGIVSRRYFAAVHRRLRELDCPDALADEAGKPNGANLFESPIWTHPWDFPPPAHLTYRPRPPHVTIIAAVGEATAKDVETLLLSLQRQTTADWELLILGCRCDCLESTMAALTPKCDRRVRWWNIAGLNNGPADVRNYGLLMLAAGRYVVYSGLGLPETDRYGEMVKGFWPPPAEKWPEDFLAGVEERCTDDGAFYWQRDGEEWLGHRSGPPFRYWRSGETGNDFVRRCLPR